MKKFEFRVYDDPADLPESTAEFLSRSRFYIGKHRAVTASELNDIQKKRGMIFCVLAFDEDKCIGMVCGYPVSGQKTADPHQIFMGTLIIDRFYSVRPSVISELFKTAITEIRKRKYRTIISETSPSNKLSFDMLLRHGFLLLNDKADHYGYYELRNYLPAVFSFFGEENMNRPEVFQEFFDYHFLMRPDRKKGSRKCERYSSDTVIQNFSLMNDIITMYINTDHDIVTGFEFQNGLAVIPVPDSSKYILKNNGTDKISVTLDQDNSSIITELSENEEKETEITEGTDVKVTFGDMSFYLLLSLSAHICTYQTKGTVNLTYSCYKASMDRTTGMLELTDPYDDSLIMRIPYSCYGSEYIQGAVKSAVLSDPYSVDADDNSITLTQFTDNGKIINSYSFSDDMISIRFSAELNKNEKNDCSRTLYSQLWINGTADGYEQRPDFADYPFWSPSGSSTVRSFSASAGNTEFTVSSDQPLIINLPSVMITGESEVNISFKKI